MAITKFSGATNNIQSLSDRPSQSDGITAAQLKLKFDQYGIDNADYINDVLTVDIDNAVSGLQTQITANDNDISALDTRLDTVEGNILNKADRTNVLEINNTMAYTPINSYHPSTKKYVDDTVAGVVLGQISDGAITPQKLSFDPATQTELDNISSAINTKLIMISRKKRMGVI